MAEKRQALGRGLSALIPETPPTRPPPARRPRRAACRSRSISTSWCPTRASRACRWTRGRSKSWRSRSGSNGIIQPILVRKAGDRYEIIAGERRWRAAQIAGLLRVPVMVREIAGRPGAAGRADREHPAREPQPDRRGLGLPPPARRVRDDPGGARRRGGEGSRLDRQPSAPAAAAGRSPAPGVAAARCRWGRPGRSSRSRTR